MVQLAAMALVVAAQALTVLAADPISAARFDGSRALVLAPDLVWQEWDSAIYGALEERGFTVTYRREVGQSPQAEGFDLVALSGERQLSEAEQRVLGDFLASGGAIYVSWDQPYAWGRGAGPGAPGLLRAAGATKGAKALRVQRVTIAQGVASAGLPQTGSELKQDVGCFRAPTEGWTAVALDPADGARVIMTAQDGAALGILAEHGRGRIAALGLPLEQEKYLQVPDLATGALDNVLGWLLAGKPEGERARLDFVTVAVPARADVTGVFVDGKPVANSIVRQVGSLKTVQLEAEGWAQSEMREIRVAYRTLTPGRNVETMVHMPWGTLRGAADSPAALAEYLASMGATICQPLLRSANGRAWYKGMPDDSPDEKLVTNYKGDFLADLIRECHDRGIKVIAGLYLDSDTPLRRYPEVKRRNRQGEAVKDNSGRLAACFNNPKGQEHNLATIEDLLARYKVDGLILDDNYWLDYSDMYTCYCPYCQEAFQRWCEAKGVAYADPAATQGGEAAERWWEHKREATRALATRVREIAASHGVPAGAGGWASSGMGMMHLAGPFDFLGEMQYSSPPRAMRGPLSLAGAHRLICLLWEPNVSGEQLEREVREAVHAGCQTVGFWTGRIAETYKAPAEKFDAMKRAFESVETEWRRFYARNVLRGDGRFAVVQGRADADELRLTVVRGERARTQKAPEAVDLSALP